MKKIFTFLVLTLLSTSVFAQVKNTLKGKQVVEVKGNCGMCKKTIEKAAFSVKGVRSAVWTAENQSIELYVNAKKTTINEVEKAIANVGYDTKNIKADDDIYNDLSSCCQYER